MKLNEQQEKLVNAIDGPILSLACPGSGKTRSLTYRTVNIYNKLDDKSRVLCLTFTNKAANEMKERISKELGIEKIPFFVGTFHALCVLIIKKFYSDIGYKKNVSIIDDKEQKDLIIKVYNNHFGIEGNSKMKDPENDEEDGKDSMIAKVKFGINNFREEAEEEDVLDDVFSDDPDALSIAKTYLKELKKNNLVDFSGILYSVYTLLKNNSNARNKLSGRWDYILVDESQDTNTIQYEIIKIFSEKKKNLLMVGDINQGIYGFRGAKPENLNKFVSDFSGCELIPLTKNYRSTPQITSFCEKIINKNKLLNKTVIETDNSDGADVNFNIFLDQESEANGIVDEIKKYISSGVKGHDIAIIYRLNKLSLELQMALTKEGIPFNVIGGPSFFSKKEIRDCIAMLRLLINPNDTLAFHKVSSLVEGIGSKTIGEIDNLANSNGITIQDICQNISMYSIKKKLVKLADDITNNFNFDYANIHAGDALDKIIKGLNYEDTLDRLYGKESGERKDNVRELINHATKFGETKNPSIEKYLDNITLNSSSDKEEEIDKVNLMTCHACKGLEFDHVFVPGLENNILPHGRVLEEAVDKTKALEEERRVFFVASSRAKKNLHISCNKFRKVRGKGGWLENKKTIPSIFLIETGLLKLKEEEV